MPTTAKIIVTNDGNTPPAGTVEKSDTWENVICACHHHGCTTDGRRTNNK